jgi:hypothetical protein
MIEYTIKETFNNNHIAFSGFRMGAVWYIMFPHYYGVLTPLNQWWKNL